MNVNQQTINSKVSPLCTLTAFALIVALGCFAQAGAQWTTPDASQNINNTNTGNVGIGTTTPTSLLEVKKSQNAGTAINIDNPFTNASNTAFSILSFKQGGANRFHIASINDNNTTHFGGGGAVQFWNFAAAPMLFATNNTEQMRLTSAGNLGIGTTAPDVKLQVHHSSANTNLANVGFADLVLALRNTSNTNGNMSVISFQDAGGYGNVNITALQKDQTNHSADLLFLTRDKHNHVWRTDENYVDRQCRHRYQPVRSTRWTSMADSTVFVRKPHQPQPTIRLRHLRTALQSR